MGLRMGRTLVALASSAGMIIGGAMSAAATSGGDDDGGGHGKKEQYGWVNVCQDVKKHDDHAYGDTKDDNPYKGTYSVKDSYGQVQKVYLKGQYNCHQVKVHKGKVTVKVLYKPAYTKLDSHADQYVDVKKGDYKKVVYKYRAVDYGWVDVCQDVKKYDDKAYGDKKDDNAYNGTYQVKDSYGQVQKVYLKGQYDCDRVKVYAGTVTVKVLYKPDYTKLTGYDSQDVYVKKGAYEKVVFSYYAVDYGWVNVCQDVKKYDDDGYGADGDDNEYKATYEVSDSYGHAQKVYVKGAHGCDQVKVYAGTITVKVLYQPEHTMPVSYDTKYVDVMKGAYEKVTYEYQAEDDDYSYAVAGNRSA